MSVDGSKSVCCPSCREYSNGKMTEKGRNQHSLGGVSAVADPDLQVRGRESHKNFFSALRASVWSKNKGGPPQDPPLLHKGRVDCTCPGRIRGYPRTSRSPNNFLQNFTALRAFSMHHPKTCSFNYIKSLSPRCLWIFA